MRYAAEDFGYTFVPAGEGGGAVASASSGDGEADGGVELGVAASSAASASAAAKDDELEPLRRSSRAGDDSSKPYVYSPPPRRYAPGGGGGGMNGNATKATAATVRDDDDDDDDRYDGGGGGGGGGGAAAALSGLGACCCCLCALLVVSGGTMLAFEAFLRAEEEEEEEGAGGAGGSDGGDARTFAGAILLVGAAAAFLLGCCGCCFSVAASCAGGGGGGGMPFGPDAFGGPDDHDGRDVRVKIRRLNDRYERAEAALDAVHLDVVGDMKEVWEAKKEEEKARREEEGRRRSALEERVRKDLERGVPTRTLRRNYRPIAFLVQFQGDTMLSSMELLRKQVSIVVNCGRAGVDRAVVVITSPGGSVSPYGLAASQLARIRKAGIRLIVCVDTVAASGGYMMASVGDVVLAAPFAVVGSIGVVTQVPNFQRFLNKNDVDAFLFTAGKHKRTVDVIGDVTEEGKAKLQEELDDMHRAFKDHVALARPGLKDRIEEVATGEFWMAVQAKRLGLVDEIMTSDEYLESICKDNEILEIVEKKKKKGVASMFQVTAHAIKGLIEGMASPSHRSVQLS